MSKGLARIVATMAVALMAAGVLAACGADEGDALSQEEFSRELNNATQQLTSRAQSELGPVVQTLERVGVNESEPIPDRVEGEVKTATDALADANRQTADEIAALEAPEEARDAQDQLVESVRTQADELEALAGEAEITVRELADAAEPPEEARQALQDLEEQGFDVQVPQAPRP